MNIQRDDKHHKMKVLPRREFWVEHFSTILSNENTEDFLFALTRQERRCLSFVFLNVSSLYYC